ncbi:MAG: hypothetical protein HYZ22_11235 [Chloroflexi bacterium]|nr:hypothetical protein [Chloroflexota bacterium]
MPYQPNKTTARWLIMLLGAIIPLIGLALMVYIGIYNRYWGDDWCYNFDFKTLGIDGAIKTYSMTGAEALRGYANNRYSLTLISGLLYLTGIFGAKITAALVIVSWFIGLFWVLSNVSKLVGFSSKIAVLLGTATLLYYVLYISPQRFQILYWTAGIHYSLAIICGIYLLGLITFQATRKSRSMLVDIIIIPVAFLAGGFSETGNAFLLASMSFVLAAVWFFKVRKTDWAVRIFPTTLIAFTTLFVSLLVLAFAPSNATRTEVVSAERSGVLETIYLSFLFSFDFMVVSIKSLPVPHLVFFAVFMSLPILSGVAPSEKRADIFRDGVIPILTSVIIVWLIISAVHAPSVMFYGAPPDPRGKSLARFAMLVGIAVIAWIIGKEINFKWNNKWLVLLSIFVMTICAVYTARTITRVYAGLPAYIYRAELWDERDAFIKEAVRQNQTQVEVLVIDMKGLGVQDIMKSKDMNGNWVATCGAQFYGLEAIRAGD